VKGLIKCRRYFQCQFTSNLLQIKSAPKVVYHFKDLIFTLLDGTTFEANVLSVENDFIEIEQIIPASKKLKTEAQHIIQKININEIIDFDRKEDFIKNIFDIDNKVEDFDYKFDSHLKYGTVVTGNNKATFYPNNNYSGVAYLNYKVFDQTNYSKTGIIKIRILPENFKNSFNNILLYPNPSNGRFRIEDFIADNIIIFDFSGKKIRNFTFTQIGNRIHVNAQTFVKGEYIIHLVYKNKLIAVKRFTIL
jgi:hypothetical protein